VDKVEQFFPEYFGFPPSISFHQRSIPTFIYTMLLPEGQTGEAWEPSKMHHFSEIGDHWTEQNCHCLKGVN